MSFLKNLISFFGQTDSLGAVFKDTDGFVGELAKLFNVPSVLSNRLGQNTVYNEYVRNMMYRYRHAEMSVVLACLLEIICSRERENGRFLKTFDKD